MKAGSVKVGLGDHWWAGGGLVCVRGWGGEDGPLEETMAIRTEGAVAGLDEAVVRRRERRGVMKAWCPRWL